MVQIYTNEIILNALIESCLNFNPKLFKTYLLSEKVIIDCPTKINFYEFFKQMGLNAKKNSIGSMFVKIEKPNWEEDTIKHYNLYDSVHKYSRLTIRIKETAETIYMETMPF